MNNDEQREALEQAIKRNLSEWRVLHNKLMMLQEQKRDLAFIMLRLEKQRQDLDATASK